VVERLNTYLAQACEPILAQGGTVDKFIGDAIMAVFVPGALSGPCPAGPERRLGWRKKPGIPHLDATTLWRSKPPDFAIGIGIHTGEAIVGNIGSPKRLEFTTIGDMVNTASRLEGLTKRIGLDYRRSRSTIEAAAGVATGRQNTRAVKAARNVSRSLRCSVWKRKTTNWLAKTGSPFEDGAVSAGQAVIDRFRFRQT